MLDSTVGSFSEALLCVIPAVVVGIIAIARGMIGTIVFMKEEEK